jgi:hypothetical protein
MASGRKLENHAAATALNYFAYNFIKIHRTLRMSPAMAAGVTDRLWDVADLVALWEAYESRREERAAQMAQWEYLIELLEITPTGFYENCTPKGVERLNELGNEGWEIAGTWSAPRTSTGVVILKRPKSK